MGNLFVRTVETLESGFVLAPERYDPKRKLPTVTGNTLSHYVDLIIQNTQPKTLAGEADLLKLDTTHAYEGFVLYRHGLTPPSDLNSAKRLLQPGDVIISRLRPYLRQVAYVHPCLFDVGRGGNKVVASTEFFVLRSKNEFPAAALVPYLLSEPVQTALAAAQEGGHHPRVNQMAVKSLPIPDAIVQSAAVIAIDVIQTAEAALQCVSSIRQLSKAAADAVGSPGLHFGDPNLPSDR